MPLLRRDLSYDDASRITGVSDPASAPASATYQYDPLDRLTVAQAGSSTRQYGYDAVGNRQHATIDGALTDYTYGSAGNQLLNLTGATATSYVYDAAGNPTTIGARTYTYNLAHRLVTLKQGATTLASYQVNGLGQRTAKTVGSTTTRFVYDEQGHLLGEYDNLGKLIQETVWLEDLPIATLRPRPGSTSNPVAIDVYYVHADHLGSPRAVTRPSDNAILWQWDNVDPFGADAANENPGGLGTFKYALRFPGQYYDAETGTHYNYFRDYDPAIGRYDQSDPIGLKGGINTYVYANDPLTQIDPTGEMGRGARDDLPPTDDCKKSEWKICEIRCAPRKAVGCYVSVNWKARGLRNGELIRSEERTVNCNCEEPKCGTACQAFILGGLVAIGACLAGPAGGALGGLVGIGLQ